MSRTGRTHLNTSLFYLMVQGINKEYIFKNDELKKKYKILMFSALEKYDIKLISYCIMSNHAHLLIFTEKIEEMSNYMKSINTSFSRYYNQVNNRVGVVFRNRYESEPIKNIQHLYSCISYIHKNPVKAKMVNHPSQYEYSTYNSYIRGTIEDEVLELIFGTKNNYLETFQKIHNNNDDEIFKDYIEDVDYNEKIIELLNTDIGKIIMNEELLENVIKDLIITNKIPIKKVCEVFKLTRYKISKILNKK